MNQRGFATLEIICVVLIISVLTTIAVPQMVRLIDKARLDYEMKTFLNNLELARSLNRSSHYQSEIFEGNSKLETGSSVIIDIKNNAYDLRIGNKSTEHKLYDGFSIKQENLGENLGDSFFIDKGKSGRVIITSKLGDQRFIYHDSVGRWRGDISEK